LAQERSNFEMRILGITTEDDSGAAIIDDGHMLAAVNEERLSRLKLVVGFPRASIYEVMQLSNTRVSELDAVLVAAKNSFFVDHLEPFDGWKQLSPVYDGNRIKQVAAKFSRFRDQFPVLEKGYYAMLAPGFLQRRQAIRRALRTEFDITCPIEFIDHHFAHCTPAYFTSGFTDALVISMDGGGDGRSSKVYAVRNGEFIKLHEISAFNSFGNYYAYVTNICGYKAMKHEGKITGLAAYGEPKYISILREFADEIEGSTINKGGVVFREALEKLKGSLPSGWTKEDLAASIQSHFEEVVQRYVSYWIRKTGLRNVALAGGVFANVRVNEEVFALPEVERIFVYPHMTDGGLAVGAAMAACVPGVLTRTMPYRPEPLLDVYLGSNFSEIEINSAIEKYGLTPENLQVSLEETVAELLVQGFVVARAEGRMEYGPRALGNRSILYHPTDRSVNDWLNKNLRRTEFMPFAPSTLYDEREKCYEQVNGAEHTAEFMTITFHCTPWMQKNMPGVVHLDNTARPHLVRKDRNPSYYKIIEEFYKRTGLPAIINTSFNMHEEPIVCNVDDCVRAFLEGNIDYLALGPFLIKHPLGTSHPIMSVNQTVTLGYH
jgi:carbamoyltransferase